MPKMVPDPSALYHLVRQINPSATLLRSWPLTGGVSAQVTALEILLPEGYTKKLIVRQHGHNDLTRNPRIAADEFRLLQTLHSAGLPVPKPYYVDRTNQIFPTPCLVVEFIEGATDLSPRDPLAFAIELATYLTRIHGMDISNLTFLPNVKERITQWISNHPNESAMQVNERQIRDLLRSSWPPPHPNKPVLLHGDYWPGNILWRENRLVGVIDWEDAALGDPLYDLANSRQELLWLCGSKAMERFTDRYQSLLTIDLADLPYWELYVALRAIANISGWGLDEVVARRMREQSQLFISRALAQLK